MDLLGWLEGLPHAGFLRRNMVAYILINAGHILGIGLLVGAILPLDLRLIGLLRAGPIAVLAPFLVRTAATGLALAILTGLLLFSVKPAEYAANPAFLIKMGLILLGLVNVVLQHRGEAWQRLHDGGETSARMRVLAGLSFATWLSALIAGRWIGFL